MKTVLNTLSASLFLSITAVPDHAGWPDFFWKTDHCPKQNQVFTTHNPGAACRLKT